MTFLHMAKKFFIRLPGRFGQDIKDTARHPKVRKSLAVSHRFLLESRNVRSALPGEAVRDVCLCDGISLSQADGGCFPA